MKNLIEILKESKTSSNEMRHYIQSWLRQDRGSYEATIANILEAMMDFFKDEMNYYEDKSKVASGKQSKEFDEAANLYVKVKKAYQNWDDEI